MVQLIQQNLNQIQDTCKRHHVRHLYLIGSATGNSFTPESDVDFLYQFNKSEISEMDYADNYFSLQELLKRKVDLVPEEKLRNPYFIQSINQHKQKIYES